MSVSSALPLTLSRTVCFELNEIFAFRGLYPVIYTPP